MLVAVTAALGVLSAGLPAVTTSPLTTGTGEIRLYLDVIEENNLPTWWATSMLVLGAAACGLVSYLGKVTGERGWWRWTLLAAVVALLSLDEMTSLHERLDRLAAGRVDLGTYPFLWLVPGAALGAAVALTVGVLLWQAPRRARGWLILGFGLLLGSALGGELIQGLLLGSGDVGPWYVLSYHAEEFGETVGAVFVLTGALSATRLGVGSPPDGVPVLLPADVGHEART